METRDLRYFVAAAEIGQLHRAADRMGRSQPALTKCIRRLESELAAKLFEREGRTLRLTAAGHALLESARTILQDIQEAAHKVNELGTGRVGRIRIGAGATTAECLLPNLFVRMLAQSPGVSFQLSTGVASVLRQMLRDGKLDLIVGPLLGSDTGEFSSFAVADDTLVVAARKGHPLSRRRRKPAELAPFSWLLPGAFVMSTHWLNVTFQSHGLTAPRMRIETDTVLLLRRLIESSDLLTFISRRDLGTSLAEIDVPDLRFHRELGAVWRPGHYLPPAADRLLTLLRKEGAGLLS